MSIRILLLPMFISFFSADFNKCNNSQDGKRITVVGTAIVLKMGAAVETDDSLIYYLDGVYRWDKEYYEKRVKVTGKLTLKEYHDKETSGNPEITAIPQVRRGIFKIIKKPKWSLVK